MKKMIVLMLVVLCCIFVTSCAADRKAWSQYTSYKDPQTLGGYWDVTMQTGQTFKHVKCTYWGTDDDTAVFEMDDGTLVVQSGACVCVSSK